MPTSPPPDPESDEREHDSRSDSEPQGLEDYLETITDPITSDNLALSYHKDFLNTQEPNQLDAAIACARHTVEVCPAENPRQLRYYVRLGSYLESRHRRFPTADNADLLEAAWQLEKAGRTAHLDRESGRDRAKRLSTNAICQQRLYELGDPEADYERAVRALENCVAAWEGIADKAKVAMHYWHFGHLYVTKFDRDVKNNKEDKDEDDSQTDEDEEDKDKSAGPDVSLLDHAMECIEKALQSLETQNDTWLDYTRQKVLFLSKRALHNPPTSDQDYGAAIDTCRTAMTACSNTNLRSSRHAEFQHILGQLYMYLPAATGEKKIENLHEATFNLQRASEDTPRSHPEWERRYEFFQDALEAFAATLGQPVGLNAKIRGLQAAVTRLLASEKEEDQGEAQAEALYSLAVFHQLRYMQRHTVDDLMIATEKLCEAVIRTGEEDYPNMLRRLGLAAEYQYILYGDEDDPKYLRLGIEVSEKAVEYVKRAGESVSNRKKASVYNTLGRCLAALADEEEEDDDYNGLIEKAVRAGESAVDLMQAGDPDDEDEASREEEYAKYVTDLEMWRGSP